MENNGVKKEKRRLLTAFDIVIIAVVVVLAALFLLWQSHKNAPASQEGDTPAGGVAVYTIELSGVEQTGVFAAGDVLYDTVKNTNIGTVRSFEIIKTMKWMDNLETGGITMSETDMNSVLLTVEAPCTFTESTVATKAGAFDLRVGKPVGVAGPGYWGSGYIVAVERG